jgi:hypothetical protein
MRKRIDLGRYDKPVEVSTGGGMIAGDLQVIMNTTSELKEVIFHVRDKHNVIWVSNRNWSMHQLLMALLDITGPAEVHIATFAMGETPARILLQLKESGLITKLYCAIDNRVDTRSAGSLQLIMSICDNYSLDDIHAKVTVIENAEWTITVIGSANYTENKRKEAGIVMNTREAAEQQLLWIKESLRDGIK